MDIEHVALQVPDPRAMAAWYVAHLGLRIVRGSEAPVCGRFLADGSGHVMVELYNNPKAAVPNYRQVDPLVLHLAFESGDVPADRERLLRAGATAAGDIERTPDGDDVAMLRDPWGVAIQLARRARPMI